MLIKWFYVHIHFMQIAFLTRSRTSYSRSRCMLNPFGGAQIETAANVTNSPTHAFYEYVYDCHEWICDETFNTWIFM